MRFAREQLRTWAVVLTVFALGCGQSDDDEESGPPGPITGNVPAGAPAMAPPMAPGVSGAGGAAGAPTNAPVGPAPTAGSVAPQPAMPGGQAGAPAPMTDAGSGGAADPGTAGTMAPGNDPIVLPPPGEPGPYKVIVEENVGKGFENAIATNDRGDGTGCLSFIGSFGGDAESNRMYATIPAGHDMALFSLYRPENLGEGVFPVLTWANGTCARVVGYKGLLEHVASHGFLAIAAHSRYTGSGKHQINGVDWVLAQNENPDSPLYKHVDTEHIGAFGHSQGGGSTGIAGADERIDATILMHGGSASRLHSPTFIMTGDGDLAPSSLRSAYNAARVPAAFGLLANSDHITMMKEPPRMNGQVTAWFRYHLLGDAEARAWFVGDDCKLCKDPEWEYLAKDLP